MARISSMLFAGILFLAGCAASRPYLGDVSLRAYTDIGGSPTTFGVEAGRIVDGNLDVAIDSDGCARGQSRGASYELCPRLIPAAIDAEGEMAERWLAEGGDLVTRVSPDGKLLRVDGTLRTANGIDRPIHVTLKFERGPQWDELRRHPVLYALAAANVGMSGEPMRAAGPQDPPAPIGTSASN